MTSPQSGSTPFSQLLGMRCVFREKGKARYELEVGPELLNKRGVAHGGVVASLLDTALGGAVVSSLHSGGVDGDARAVGPVPRAGPPRPGDGGRAAGAARPVGGVRGRGDPGRRGKDPRLGPRRLDHLAQEAGVSARARASAGCLRDRHEARSLRDPRADWRRRHGRGLPRPRHAAGARRRRSRSCPRALAARRRSACAASSRRRAPPALSTIPTSWPSTTSAPTTASPTWSRSCSKARRCASGSAATAAAAAQGDRDRGAGRARPGRRPRQGASSTAT